jgi:hypothetical protein
MSGRKEKKSINLIGGSSQSRKKKAISRKRRAPVSLQQKSRGSSRSTR